MQLPPENMANLASVSQIGRELTEDGSGLHRVILYSKKAAKEFRWNEEDDIADNPGFLDIVIQFGDMVSYTNTKSVYIYDQSEESTGVYFETLDCRFLWLHVPPHRLQASLVRLGYLWRNHNMRNCLCTRLTGRAVQTSE